MLARNPFVPALFVAAALAVAIAPSASGVEEDPQAGARANPTAEGWYARIETSMGSFLVRLLPEQAPQSVAHFTALAEGRLEWLDPFTGVARNDPYYDGIEIHKVRASQRFEFGDRTGTGRGAAPYYVPPETGGPVDFRYPWRVGLTSESLGRVSGSMLVVTASSQPFLDGRHPCLGLVVSGRDVVQSITTVKANGAGKPIEPVRIEKIRIFRVGAPDPLPEPTRYQPKPRGFEMNPALRDDDRRR